ncbi:hypothetical protein H2198_003080 [Neophaeococcomyces mojaviensis]|uniref:Uncharacterized protein n=1 Tax=Neophaeococcomyces mojaviensis TaxID=3383035 RepID=A0ACC3ACC6_9EURO|nr:hypothetical protein H2198_003080 [Knufia sp. JES_112]
MAEITGLAISTAALVGLFTTCVQCFEVVDISSNHSEDFAVLTTSFEVQHVRLIVWGQALGLDASPNNVLEWPETKKVVHKCLCSIQMLFEDGDKLVSEYGLHSATSQPVYQPPVFEETYSRFRERFNVSQTQASLSNTIKWAIQDEAKFKNLVADLKSLIDSLENTTQSTEVLGRQREIIEEEMATILDENSLKLVEEATSPAESQIGHAASRRRLQIADEHSNDTHNDILSETSFNSEESHLAKQKNFDATSTIDNEDWIILPTQQLEESMSQTERTGQSHGIQPVDLSLDLSALTLESNPVKWKPITIEESDVLEQLSNSCWRFKRSHLRIAKELISLTQGHNTTDWRVGLSKIDAERGDIICFFCGPMATQYEQGIYYVRIHLHDEYPHQPPACQLLTQVYHPNFDLDGRVGLSILCRDWSAVWDIASILIAIASMLDAPDVDDPLVPEIAEQYVRDNDQYCITASEYTLKYATGALPELEYYGHDGKPWWSSIQVL